MGLLISEMLGAKTADQSADLLKLVQKTVEWLRYNRALELRRLTKLVQIEAPLFYNHILAGHP